MSIAFIAVVLAIFALIVSCAALIIATDSAAHRPRSPRGGYMSGSTPVGALPRVPPGPAPGARLDASLRVMSPTDSTAERLRKAGAKLDQVIADRREPTP